VILAGLSFTSSAIGQFSSSVIIPPRPAPAQGNGAAEEDLGDSACDVAALQEQLKAMLDQRRELKRDWREAQTAYGEARRGDASRREVVRLKREANALKQRLRRLDRRIKNLQARINDCHPGAVPPIQELDDPELDEVDDELVEDPGLDVVGMKISCNVPPGGETTSVRFRNVGQKTIPAGTPVKWSVKAQGGEFSLPQNLPVGAELTAADLLKLGVPGSASCQSRL
jgi:hypothetical protein